MNFTSQTNSTLSAERRELLAHLLRERGVQTPRTRPALTIEKIKHEGRLPLAFNQEGLWFIEQIAAGKANNSMPGTVRLQGRLNLSALENTLSEIVRRHEILRTTFRKQENGTPYQDIAPPRQLKIPVVDLQHLPSAQREAEAVRIATEEAKRPFDLSSDQPFRFSLLRLREDEFALMLNFHHIVADGWSMGVFTRELVELYGSFCNGKTPALPELPIRFSDYAVWQRKRWQGKLLDKELTYWRGRMQNPPILELPTDRPRPAVQSFRGNHQPVSFSKNQTEEIRQFARRQGCTVYMTLLAGFNALLFHYSRQKDIVVGSTFANRNLPELENLIGFFVNTIPIRTDLSGNPTFADLLKRVREVTLGASAHQELPLAKLVNDLQPQRDLSRNPLYQVVFDLLTPERNPALYGYGLASTVSETVHLPDLKITPMDVEGGEARFDLAVFIWDQPQGFIGTFEYSSDLFNSSTIVRMIDNFKSIMSDVVKQPAICLVTLSEHLEQANKQKIAAFDVDYKNTIHNKLKRIKRRAVTN